LNLDQGDVEIEKRLSCFRPQASNSVKAVVTLRYTTHHRFRKAASPEADAPGRRFLVAGPDSGNRQNSRRFCPAPALQAGSPNQHAPPRCWCSPPPGNSPCRFAEAFNTYASQLPQVRILPIYGGADFRDQIAQGFEAWCSGSGRLPLAGHGVTCGRERRPLRIRSWCSTKADEMLRDGLHRRRRNGCLNNNSLEQRQVVLFFRHNALGRCRLSRKFLKDPAEVTIRQKGGPNRAPFRQRHLVVNWIPELESPDPCS